MRSEEHTSELQSRENLVCRLLLEKKKKKLLIQLPQTKQQHYTSHINGLRPLTPRIIRTFVPTCSLVHPHITRFFLFFFFNDTATTEIYTLSLHDALPI